MGDFHFFQILLIYTIWKKNELKTFNLKSTTCSFKDTPPVAHPPHQTKYRASTLFVLTFFFSPSLLYDPLTPNVLLLPTFGNTG